MDRIVRRNAVYERYRTQAAKVRYLLHGRQYYCSHVNDVSLGTVETNQEDV